jgi:hypothetical protein
MNAVHETLRDVSNCVLLCTLADEVRAPGHDAAGVQQRPHGRLLCGAGSVGLDMSGWAIG